MTIKTIDINSSDNANKLKKCIENKLKLHQILDYIIAIKWKLNEGITFYYLEISCNEEDKEIIKRIIYECEENLNLEN